MTTPTNAHKHTTMWWRDHESRDCCKPCCGEESPNPDSDIARDLHKVGRCVFHLDAPHPTCSYCRVARLLDDAIVCEGCKKPVAVRMEHYDWMANNGRFRCQAPLELEPEPPCPNADVSNEPWITHTTCSLCAPQPEREGCALCGATDDLISVTVPAPETPSPLNHAVTEVGDCPSWCEACRAELREERRVSETPSPEVERIADLVTEFDEIMVEHPDTGCPVIDGIGHDWIWRHHAELVAIMRMGLAAAKETK